MRFKHFNPDYTAWEANEPNSYRLESLADGEALFLRISDNEAAPLRYSYTREGESLTFRGAGEEGEQPLVLEFTLRKSSDAAAQAYDCYIEMYFFNLQSEVAVCLLSHAW